MIKEIGFTSAQAAFWHSWCYKYDFCISLSSPCRTAAIYIHGKWIGCITFNVGRRQLSCSDKIADKINLWFNHCIYNWKCGVQLQISFCSRFCEGSILFKPCLYMVCGWRKLASFHPLCTSLTSGWMDESLAGVVLWLKPQLNQINHLDQVVLCISFTWQAKHLNIFGYTWGWVVLAYFETSLYKSIHFNLIEAVNAHNECSWVSVFNTALSAFSITFWCLLCSHKPLCFPKRRIIYIKIHLWLHMSNMY